MLQISPKPIQFFCLKHKNLDQNPKFPSPESNLSAGDFLHKSKRKLTSLDNSKKFIIDK